MARNEKTSAIIDGMLKTLVLGGTISAGIVAPNMMQALDKPLSKFFDKMDERSSQREYKRILQYMVQQGLVRGEYEHGLSITNKGKKRLMDTRLSSISFPVKENWDKCWRMVLYDVPEDQKSARDALTSKLRHHNFWLLQRSVWIYPFPCREQIETITMHYGISKYVTYLEINYIDNQQKLIEKFKAKNIL